MAGIFISYRRDDSAPYAGRLYDRLSARFGADVVFMDVDDIKPGANFVSLIDEKVGSCDALITVIGTDWLRARDPKGRQRLADPADFVHVEIATALRREILVIPALVNGAAMPSARDLPEPLAALAQRQAVELTDRDFPRDSEKLLAALEKVPALKNLTVDSGVQERKRQARGMMVWVLLIPVLLFLWIAFWKMTGSSDPRPIADRSQAPAPLSGTWEAEVSYSWGGSFKESFVLESNGDQLIGTASFLGDKRGIQEGKIDGKKLSFVVPFRSRSGSDVTEHRARYTGTIVGNEIRFTLQDDRGYPPVKFVAKRSSRAA